MIKERVLAPFGTRYLNTHKNDINKISEKLPQKYTKKRKIYESYKNGCKKTLKNKK